MVSLKVVVCKRKSMHKWNPLHATHIRLAVSPRSSLTSRSGTGRRGSARCRRKGCPRTRPSSYPTRLTHNSALRYRACRVPKAHHRACANSLSLQLVAALPSSSANRITARKASKAMRISLPSLYPSIARTCSSQGSSLLVWSFSL